MILPACRGSGKSAKKLRKRKDSLCAPGPEEDSCNVIATLRHDQSATTESHRIRSLEGSNAGPSHFAALLLVEPITFLPANHYDDSELQPFVTNSFTRLPCRGGLPGLRYLQRRSSLRRVLPPPRSAQRASGAFATAKSPVVACSAFA